LKDAVRLRIYVTSHEMIIFWIVMNMEENGYGLLKDIIRMQEYELR
jgi:hypothetical protein